MIIEIINKIKYNYKLWKIKRYPDILFEKIEFQNNMPRLQICRQASMVRFGIKIEDKRGFAFLVLVGEVEKFNESFKKTKYYEKAQKLEIDSLKYVILTNSDPSNLNKVYFDIFKQVFGYPKDKEYSTELTIFK